MKQRIKRRQITKHQLGWLRMVCYVGMYGQIHRITYKTRQNFDQFSKWINLKYLGLQFRENLVGGDWNHGMDYDLPFSWESSGPKWRSPSFFRGVGWDMLKPSTRSCWIPSNHVPTNDGVALPRCSTTNCSQLAIVLWVGIWKRIHRCWENHRNVTGWIFQLRFMRPFWVNPIFCIINHLLLFWLIMLNWIYQFWRVHDTRGWIMIDIFLSIKHYES